MNVFVSHVSLPPDSVEFLKLPGETELETKLLIGHYSLLKGFHFLSMAPYKHRHHT